MSDPRPGKSAVIPPKAYENPDFLHSREGRAIRILSEYQEPLSRFEHYDIDDTVVFMGSARKADGCSFPRRASYVGQHARTQVGQMSFQIEYCKL